MILNVCFWVDFHSIRVLSLLFIVCVVQKRPFLFLFLFHEWCHFSKTRHKTNKPKSKRVKSDSFLDLLVINSILRFSYHRIHQNVWRSQYVCLTLDQPVRSCCQRSGCAGPCHGSLCSLQNVGAFSPMASGKNASEWRWFQRNFQVHTPWVVKRRSMLQDHHPYLRLEKTMRVLNNFQKWIKLVKRKTFPKYNHCFKF